MSLLPDQEEDLNDKIFTDKLSLLYKNSLLTIPAGLVCFLLAFIILLKHNHNTIIFIWLGLAILVAIFRVIQFYLFKKQVYTNKFYLSSFMTGVILSGMLWGMAGSIFMFPNDMLHQMVIIIILTVVNAGAVQILQSNLIASSSFIILSISPLIIWLGLQKDSQYLIISVAMLVYMLFLILVAWRSYKALNEKLKLFYQNIELVKKFTHSNQKLQESNLSLALSQERFQSLIENSPTGTGILDLKGNIISANNALCHFFGYSKKELLTKRFQELTYPEDLLNELNFMKLLVQGNMPSFQIDNRHIHQDGHLIWTLLTVTTLKSSSGNIEDIVVQLQNIGQRKQAEEELKDLNLTMIATLEELKEREQEDDLINKLNDLLQICSTSHEAYPRITIMAKQLFPELSGALAMLNSSSQTMDIVEWWGNEKIVEPEFCPKDCFAIRSGDILIANDPAINIPCPHYLTSPKGSYICLPLMIQGKLFGELFFSATANNIISKTQQDLIIKFGNVIKISLSNIQLRELLEEQSIRDPLTNLFNRRYLNEILSHELLRAIRNKNKVHVVMLDIDFFKKFNDSYGHDAGDEVLKLVSELLQKRFRGNDTAYRFGGEEFLVTLEDSGFPNILKKFEDFRKEVEDTTLFFHEKSIPSITVSIGIATAPEQGDTVEEIISAADKALYKAKQLGRNRIEVYKA